MITPLNNGENSFFAEHRNLHLAWDPDIFYPLRWILLDYSSTVKLYGVPKVVCTARMDKPSKTCGRRIARVA
jgi:hypothetical protein